MIYNDNSIIILISYFNEMQLGDWLCPTNNSIQIVLCYLELIATFSCNEVYFFHKNCIEPMFNLPGDYNAKDDSTIDSAFSIFIYCQLGSILIRLQKCMLQLKCVLNLCLVYLVMKLWLLLTKLQREKHWTLFRVPAFCAGTSLTRRQWSIQLTGHVILAFIRNVNLP